MDILNSTWFLRMLKKAGASPQERMLALFDILGDWLDAPHMHENLKGTRGDHQPRILLEYLTAQAAATGAQDHELLAQQLYFMASSIVQEELRNPGCAAAKHARQVAQALIQAQTQKDHSFSKRSAYAIAAGVFMLTAVGSWLMFATTSKPPVVNIAANAAMTKPAAFLVNPEAASPEQTAAMFATLEQMRKGTCQFPEALMLPETQKGVYLENVVAGHVPSKAKDQEVAGQLMLKVRCNYTPRLMANSTG